MPASLRIVIATLRSLPDNVPRIAPAITGFVAGTDAGIPAMDPDGAARQPALAADDMGAHP
jgi:hypothetical protein